MSSFFFKFCLWPKAAGKPNFYTHQIKFLKVTRIETGKVYTEGCVKELTRLLDWKHKKSAIPDDDEPQLGLKSGTHEIGMPHALYIGDSLFADLVDAKREFGWTTAAVTPEVGYETDIQQQVDAVLAEKSINLVLDALRTIQVQLGTSLRTEEDIRILDSLERLVSLWRDRETHLFGNPFGSVFRARYQPSLFSHSLKRYCDLYMTSVSSLRHYSPQHRFYPEQKHRLLSHEMQQAEQKLSLDELLEQLQNGLPRYA
jgi:5' nucleotidase family